EQKERALAAKTSRAVSLAAHAAHAHEMPPSGLPYMPSTVAHHHLPTALPQPKSHPPPQSHISVPNAASTVQDHPQQTAPQESWLTAEALKELDDELSTHSRDTARAEGGYSALSSGLLTSSKTFVKNEFEDELIFESHTNFDQADERLVLEKTSENFNIRESFHQYTLVQSVIRADQSQMIPERLNLFRPCEYASEQALSAESIAYLKELSNQDTDDINPYLAPPTEATNKQYEKQQEFLENEAF
ncbi:MAG: hypothetical protein Q9180_007103, partial [Flavoplaca navasiana]